MIAICHDQQRLPEIYRLRALCWKQLSDDSSVAAKESWQDNLDCHPSAIHWIISDDSRIVASARLNVLDNIDRLPYPDIFSGVEIECKPFAFYSRLVVHPDYQGRGYSLGLDTIRLKYLLDKKIDMAMATARGWRLEKLGELGFKVIKPVRGDDDPGWDLGNAYVVTVNRKDIIL